MYIKTVCTFVKYAAFCVFLNCIERRAVCLRQLSLLPYIRLPHS